MAHQTWRPHTVTWLVMELIFFSVFCFNTMGSESKIMASISTDSENVLQLLPESLLGRDKGRRGLANLE